MINRHMTSFQCTNLLVVIKIPDKSNLRKQRFIVAYSSKDFFHPHWQERYCCKSRRCGSQSKKLAGHIAATVRRIPPSPVTEVYGVWCKRSYVKRPTFRFWKASYINGLTFRFWEAIKYNGSFIRTLRVSWSLVNNSMRDFLCLHTVLFIR